MIRIALVLEGHLEAAEEEELLVRVGDRTADAAARIIVGRAALRVGGPAASGVNVMIVCPVIGIQNIIANVEVALAVVMLSARAARGVNNDRTVCRVGAEV